MNCRRFVRHIEYGCTGKQISSEHLCLFGNGRFRTRLEFQLLSDGGHRTFCKFGNLAVTETLGVEALDQLTRTAFTAAQADALTASVDEADLHPLHQDFALKAR